MSIFNLLIKSVHAADIPLGPIKGVGNFGFETASVSGPETQTQLDKVLSSLVTVFTVVGSLAFLAYLIMGGINWLTAGGDKAKVETAQKMITNALIGLAIIVVSLLITDLVGKILGIDILNPFKTLFGSSTN